MTQETTLVTALFDIGSDQLAGKHQRPFSLYLSWFKVILSLRVPMVVYIEPEQVEFVKRERAGIEEGTQIVPTTIAMLEEMALKRQIETLLSQPGFKQGRPRPDRPELNLPLYNLICYHKINWVVDAIEQAPFQSKYYLWLDAGYGKGGPLIQKFAGQVWPDPKSIKAFDDGRFHIVQLRPFPQKLIENEARRHIRHRFYHAGGAFGGTAETVQLIAKKYNALLQDLLDRGIIDDDQGVLTSLYARHPHLFTNVGPTYENWYEMLNYLGPEHHWAIDRRSRVKFLIGRSLGLV